MPFRAGGRPPLDYSEEHLAVFWAFHARQLSLREALSGIDMKSSNFYYHYHRALKAGLIPPPK